MTLHRVIKHIAFTACLLAGSMNVSAGVVAASAPPLEAVWRVQQIELNVRTGRILYSCDGLRAKITAILTAVGARDGLDVNLPCRTGGLTNNAIAMITLSFPIEATVDNVRDVTTYSTQAQLAARLNGIQLPTANDVQRFMAQRRAIALNKQRQLRLDAGDCALLRALTAQVFPQMDVRIDAGGFSCPHGSAGRIRPRLHVTALMPSPSVPGTYLTADRK